MGVKILFTADLHLYNEDRFSKPDADGRTEHLRNQMNVLYEISALATYHDAILMVGGDITEQKDRIPNVVLNSFYRWVNDCEARLLIAYTGSHDAALVTQPAIQPLKYFPNAIFLSTPTLFVVEPNGLVEVQKEGWSFSPPTEGTVVGVIPHQKETEVIEATIERWPPLDVLFIHQLIEGATVGNYQLPGTLRTSAFKDVPIVFAGDIHKAQTLGNIHYVGSPYQNDFGEEGYEPRVILIDLDDPHRFEPIPLKGSPTYLTAVVVYQSDWLTESFWEGKCCVADYVKLKVTCTPEQFLEINQNEVKKFFEEKIGVRGLIFEWNFVKQERETVITESTAPEEALINYLDACSESELRGLEKDTLAYTGRQLLAEEDVYEKEND